MTDPHFKIHRLVRAGAFGLLCAAIAVSTPHTAAAQTSDAAHHLLEERTPKSWIAAASANELAMIKDDDHPMRYRMRKVDRKGDTTREVIESADGNVARLIQRNGQPLTPEENRAEVDRLKDILRSPADFIKHQERGSAERHYAIELIGLLPSAMIYTYAPEQPQPSESTSRQIVIDFKPDPAFHPPTMISEALTGFAGRAWIDERTQTLTRIEGHLLHAVDFGWGVVAKIYPGGTLELEQKLIDDKRWVFSHFQDNLTVREMLLHTVTEKTKINAWNFELLPAPMSVTAAIHALLAIPVPLHSPVNSADANGGQ